MAYRSFEDLEIWKTSSRLAVEITKEFANCNNYSLKDQILRSAISIPSNIAEGAERDSIKEYIRFLHIAKGSAAELRTQLYIATELSHLPKEISKTYIATLKTLSSQTHSLIKSLKPKT